ncbi:MAG TPA: hypothetical protein DCL44_03875 [Elusimicrobia bacterium]|nr:hypothetical protein [Elusimicrobiota bacterium]
MKPQKQEEVSYLPEKGKMEALGRLACKVAHDFNNILGVIEGYATLAIGGAGKNELLERDLQEIRAAAAKAAALGKQLLAFGGKQVMNKTPCSVNVIIENTLKRPELPQGGDFKIEPRFGTGLPGITADAVLLEQALVNLLVNAREATDEGGTAVICSSALQLEGNTVHSPNPQKAGTLFIKITVQDHGTGISAEVFEHLFEPLFSNTKTSNGAGMGLSTVYGVARQHNGWVEVKSAPGQGSEFALFLPATTA